ncbi:MAG TPA: phosphoribosyltransferase family protein [Chitinophagaceae bacterium]|nr:phosphoribosyltransferase family protein [Chitinophagaceae bacterium]
MKTKNAFSKATQAFAGLFFPEVCYGCGSDIINKDQILCLRCLNKIPFTNFTGKSENPVEKIFWGRIQIESAASLVFFSKETIVAHLLHQLKYKGKKEVGHYCGRLTGEAIRDSGMSDNFDALIPLPLFKKKEKMRGYNQATMICEGISSVINKPVLKNVIGRSSFTETQTHKSRIERWENMQERFILQDSSLIEGKHILLVDDVITTGATLEACGSVLLQAKATKLSIFTFAYSSSTGYF